MSLLASAHAVEEKLGHRYHRIGPLADDPATPRAAYVSTEALGDAEGVLVGGLMYVGATVAAGAVVASGGLTGVLLARWVGDHHGRYLQDQIERGGLLLWVRTWDSDDELRAVSILRRHAGECVHVHGALLSA